ncbi:hypothetical protein BN13_600014 [Nostocoides jenkinsii Ben 74]|uniref:Uncharacterized protein n=1 Tax=Nostocoides jenkinsii Ben 74 TaxID=1193518 RepID=A0A077MDZ5_9MICO|nr:hypothetical protein BN13_600014 [Tetrasphaera jenkinsii Ben 74]
MSRPAGAFDLAEDDTIASVLGAYAAAVAGSRARVAGLGWTTWSRATGAAPCRCALCCFMCCVSSPSIAATPTSFASRCWPPEASQRV